MKPDSRAQFSVDVVRIDNNALVAHRNLDDAMTTSTFDFPAPGDAPVQFHLSGSGDRARFERLTFAYLGPTP
jgi:hypothetical protein